MIGLDDYDSEQQSTKELPEKPLKEWRRKFEAGSLVSSNLMQYFQAASPFFFTIDQTAEYSDLGKFKSFFFVSVHSVCVCVCWLSSEHFWKAKKKMSQQNNKNNKNSEMWQI